MNGAALFVYALRAWQLTMVVWKAIEVWAYSRGLICRCRCCR